MRTTWQKGIPLDNALQTRLRSLVTELGEKQVAELLEVGVTSVVRAAAGLGLRRGTIHLIRTKLEQRKAA